jgi:hypothetical protein
LQFEGVRVAATKLQEKAALRRLVFLQLLLVASGALAAGQFACAAVSVPCRSRCVANSYSQSKILVDQSRLPCLASSFSFYCLFWNAAYPFHLGCA